MKNKFKGFTLVECIVALAILGIATLTMAQIYGGVAKVNKSNHEANASISNQMKYVEKKLDDGLGTDVITLQYGGSDDIDPQLDDTAGGAHKPPHEHESTNGGTTAFIVIEEITRDASGTITETGTEFSYPIDVSVLKTRDNDDNVTTENEGPKYKYFTAH